MINTTFYPTICPDGNWNETNIENWTHECSVYTDFLLRFQSVAEIVAALQDPVQAAQAYEDLTILADPETLPVLLESPIVASCAVAVQDYYNHDALLVQLMTDYRNVSTAQLHAWIEKLPNHDDVYNLLKQVGTAAAQQVVIDYWERSPLLRGGLDTPEAIPVQQLREKLDDWLSIMRTIEGPRLQQWVASLWPERPKLALITALTLSQCHPDWLVTALNHPPAISFLAHIYAQSWAEYLRLRMPDPVLHFLRSQIHDPAQRKKFDQFALFGPFEYLLPHCRPPQKIPRLVDAVRQRDHDACVRLLDYRLLDGPVMTWLRPHLSPQDLLWLWSHYSAVSVPLTHPPVDEWQQLSLLEQLRFLADEEHNFPFDALPAWIAVSLEAGEQSKNPEVQAAYQALVNKHKADSDQADQDDPSAAKPEEADIYLASLHACLQNQCVPLIYLTLSPSVWAELNQRWAEASAVERRRLLVQVIPALYISDRPKMRDWLDWAEQDGDVQTLRVLSFMWLDLSYDSLTPLYNAPLPEVSGLHEMRLWRALIHRDPRLKGWLHEALTTSRWESVRIVALECVLRMNPADIDAALYADVLYCLRHGNYRERCQAVIALLRRPHPDWMPALQALLEQEPLDTLRAQIRYALILAEQAAPHGG